MNKHLDGIVGEGIPHARSHIQTEELRKSTMWQIIMDKHEWEA